MVAYAIKKLYLIYPRYPEGGYHHPSLSTLTYSFVQFSYRSYLCHSLEGMWGYIFVPFDVLFASVYWSYRYSNPRKCDIFNEILRVY